MSSERNGCFYCTDYKDCKRCVSENGYAFCDRLYTGDNEEFFLEEFDEYERKQNETDNDSHTDVRTK